MPAQNRNVRDSHSQTNSFRITSRESEVSQLRKLGDEAFAESKYNEALQYYLTAYNVLSSLGDPLVESILMASIANTYAKIGNYELAEQYYRQATEKANIDWVRPVRPRKISKQGLIIFMIVLTMVWLSLIGSIGIEIQQKLNPTMIPLLELINFGFVLISYIFLIKASIPSTTTLNDGQGQKTTNIILNSTDSKKDDMSIGNSKHWEQVNMKTLIIIPTYNELEYLRPILDVIFSFAPTTDVLIVDDNSPDGTGKVADEISAENPHVHVLHRAGKLGLGTAYIAGFKYAIAHDYDAAFEMDADFSHDPRYLPDFLKAIEEADLVIGSRYIPGGDTPNWSFTRRMISICSNIFARFMLDIPVHDCTTGYRCYRRDVLESIDLDTVQSQGYAFQIELTYRVIELGFKIVEIPIIFMDRRVGKSKLSRKNVIEGMIYVLRTRFRRQSRLRTPATSHENKSQRSANIPGAQDETESRLRNRVL